MSRRSPSSLFPCTFLGCSRLLTNLLLLSVRLLHFIASSRFYKNALINLILFLNIIFIFYSNFFPNKICICSTHYRLWIFTRKSLFFIKLLYLYTSLLFSNIEFISNVKFKWNIVLIRIYLIIRRRKSRQRRSCKIFFIRALLRFIDLNATIFVNRHESVSTSPIFRIVSIENHVAVLNPGNRFAEKGGHPPAYTTALLQLLVCDSFAGWATWRTVTCDRIVICVSLKKKKRNSKPNKARDKILAATLNRIFYPFPWLRCKQ